MTPPKLLVLYVPALDRRWINAHDTPHVHRLIERHGDVRLDVHPSTELLPSMVTGVWPHEHRLWQVRLRDREERRTLGQRLLDAIPHTLTTAAQCGWHRLDKGFDLPTVEPRRRRRFELHRTKVQRRHGGDVDAFTREPGLASIFSEIGPGARYRTLFSFDDAGGGMGALVDGGPDLDFLELYAFDLYCHWNLDRPDAIRSKLALVDQMIGDAATRAEVLGLTALLVVDHGQEPVRHQVDVLARLRQTGVPAGDYTCYIEVANARFWYFTQDARRRITEALGTLEHTTLVDGADMARYHIHLDPAEGFGDAYLYADQGAVFFPHDFYHPLVNWYMARKTPEQSPRKTSPVHRGYHGHLPGPPADVGYLVAMGPRCRRTADAGELIDFAPTVLSLLGRPVPAAMKGRPLVEAA
jgi:hypothetical protein